MHEITVATAGLHTPDQVQAAIEQRHREIIGLKRHLNTFTLINKRLPPELLTEVFLFYIADKRRFDIQLQDYTLSSP